jgi:hypothetical protein
VGNDLICGETVLGSWTEVFGTGDGIGDGAAMVGMTARSAVFVRAFGVGCVVSKILFGRGG